MQRLVALSVSLVLSGCSGNEPVASNEDRPPPDPKFDVAYQQVQGSSPGVMLFFDEPTALALWEFRDERDAVQKVSSESLIVCHATGGRCLIDQGRPPILSDVPANLTLGGQFRYTETPVRKWASNCRAISASADSQTTTSVNCPLFGVVEIMYSGPTGAVERYELKSYRGLFARR